MKKCTKVWRVILIVICISIVMTGCGNNDSQNQSEGREEPVMGDGKENEKKQRRYQGEELHAVLSHRVQNNTANKIHQNLGKAL